MNENDFYANTNITDLMDYKRARKTRNLKMLIETIHSPELKYPFYTFVGLSLLITFGSVLYFFLYVI